MHIKKFFPWGALGGSKSEEAWVLNKPNQTSSAKSQVLLEVSFCGPGLRIVLGAAGQRCSRSDGL